MDTHVTLNASDASEQERLLGNVLRGCAHEECRAASELRGDSSVQLTAMPMDGDTPIMPGVQRVRTTAVWRTTIDARTRLSSGLDILSEHQRQVDRDEGRLRGGFEEAMGEVLRASTCYQVVSKPDGGAATKPFEELEQDRREDLIVELDFTRGCEGSWPVEAEVPWENAEVRRRFLASHEYLAVARWVGHQSGPPVKETPRACLAVLHDPESGLPKPDHAACDREMRRVFEGARLFGPGPNFEREAIEAYDPHLLVIAAHGVRGHGLQLGAGRYFSPGELDAFIERCPSLRLLVLWACDSHATFAKACHHEGLMALVTSSAGEGVVHNVGHEMPWTRLFEALKGGESVPYAVQSMRRELSRIPVQPLATPVVYVRGDSRRPLFASTPQPLPAATPQPLPAATPQPLPERSKPKPLFWLLFTLLVVAGAVVLLASENAHGELSSVQERELERQMDEALDARDCEGFSNALIAVADTWREVDVRDADDDAADLERLAADSRGKCSFLSPGGPSADGVLVLSGLSAPSWLESISRRLSDVLPAELISKLDVQVRVSALEVPAGAGVGRDRHLVSRLCRALGVRVIAWRNQGTSSDPPAVRTAACVADIRERVGDSALYISSAPTPVADLEAALSGLLMSRASTAFVDARYEEARVLLRLVMAAGDDGLVRGWGGYLAYVVQDEAHPVPMLAGFHDSERVDEPERATIFSDAELGNASEVKRRLAATWLTITMSDKEQVEPARQSAAERLRVLGTVASPALADSIRADLAWFDWSRRPAPSSCRENDDGITSAEVAALLTQAGRVDDALRLHAGSAESPEAARAVVEASNLRPRRTRLSVLDLLTEKPTATSEVGELAARELTDEITRDKLPGHQRRGLLRVINLLISPAGATLSESAAKPLVGGALEAWSGDADARSLLGLIAPFAVKRLFRLCAPPTEYPGMAVLAGQLRGVGDRLSGDDYGRLLRVLLNLMATVIERPQAFKEWSNLGLLLEELTEVDVYSLAEQVEQASRVGTMSLEDELSDLRFWAPLLRWGAEFVIQGVDANAWDDATARLIGHYVGRLTGSDTLALVDKVREILARSGEIQSIPWLGWAAIIADEIGEHASTKDTPSAHVIRDLMRVVAETARIVMWKGDVGQDWIMSMYRAWDDLATRVAPHLPRDIARIVRYFVAGLPALAELGDTVTIPLLGGLFECQGGEHQGSTILGLFQVSEVSDTLSETRLMQGYSRAADRLCAVFKADLAEGPVAAPMRPLVDAVDLFCEVKLPEQTLTPKALEDLFGRIESRLAALGASRVRSDGHSALAILLATYFGGVGKHDRSAEWFGKAIEHAGSGIGPDAASLWLDQAIQFLQAGAFQSAGVSFDRYRLECPRLSWASGMAEAAVQLRQGKAERASETLKSYASAVSHVGFAEPRPRLVLLAQSGRAFLRVPLDLPREYTPGAVPTGTFSFEPGLSTSRRNAAEISLTTRAGGDPGVAQLEALAFRALFAASSGLEREASQRLEEFAFQVSPPEGGEHRRVTPHPDVGSVQPTLLWGLLGTCLLYGREDLIELVTSAIDAWKVPSWRWVSEALHNPAQRVLIEGLSKHVNHVRGIVEAGNELHATDLMPWRYEEAEALGDVSIPKWSLRRIRAKRLLVKASEHAGLAGIHSRIAELQLLDASTSELAAALAELPPDMGFARATLGADLAVNRISRSNRAPQSSDGASSGVAGAVRALADEVSPARAAHLMMWALAKARDPRVLAELVQISDEIRGHLPEPWNSAVGLAQGDAMLELGAAATVLELVDELRQSTLPALQVDILEARARLLVGDREAYRVLGGSALRACRDSKDESRPCQWVRSASRSRPVESEASAGTRLLDASW